MSSDDRPSVYCRSQTVDVKITNITEDTCNFTLSGTDVSMANALRRVMIAEVSNCLQYVYINISLRINSLITR